MLKQLPCTCIYNNSMSIFTTLYVTLPLMHQFTVDSCDIEIVSTIVLFIWLL